MNKCLEWNDEESRGKSEHGHADRSEPNVALCERAQHSEAQTHQQCANRHDAELDRTATEPTCGGRTHADADRGEEKEARRFFGREPEVLRAEVEHIELNECRSE